MPALVRLLLLLFCLVPLAGFDLFATHEVTVQFATHDGRPMPDAEVKVFAPGNLTTPAQTGRTDKTGKFVFGTDRDGFWTAVASAGGEVARVMIRVGGPATPQPSRISPYWVLALLGILLVIAAWYRILRAKTRRR